MNTTNLIFRFSSHLFWDVKREDIDLDKNRSYVISQILEYGLLNDWKLILSYYGMKQIVQTAMDLRSLEKKALSFISQLSGIPKEKFKCYIYQRSIPPHWNF